jgi:hypothetical protein
MRALFVTLSALAMTACGPLVENGGGRSGLSNGQALSELELEEFDSVSLRGPDNVVVEHGDAFDIRIEGDDDIVALIEFEIHDGTLQIARKRRSGFSVRSNSATVHITMPAINSASLRGSGDMQIDRAEGEEFEASVAGSGSITIAALETVRAGLDIAGSGNISAAGTVADIDIDIAGSGDVEGADLRVERAEVGIRGSGNVEIFATEEVSGRMVGSGDVRVRGGAQCTARSVGSGSLNCSDS